MTSNTLRGQAAAAILALMDEEIFFVEYRYPKSQDRGYTAKVTKEQYDQIIQQQKSVQPEQVGLVLNELEQFAQSWKTLEKTIYGVMSTESVNSAHPYTIVEILKVMNYSELELQIDPLRLKYLVQVLPLAGSSETNKTAEREKKAVDLAVARLIENTKKHQALALLGEDGVKAITESLSIENIDMQ